MKRCRLGVNIDHVATLRQARGGVVPSPKMAALMAQSAGASGITIHLREDRRHIQDSDVKEIKRAIRVPLNLEMALEDAMIRFALRVLPEHVCLVPEKRQELTTEGGLDVIGKQKKLVKAIPQFKKKRIQVSLFIDPSLRHIQAAHALGADAVELHTGAYANANGSRKRVELARIKRGAAYAKSLGLQVHAGHGLDYENTKAVAAIAEIEELNIGHSIISYSIFVGLKQAVREMKTVIQKARK